VIAFGSLVGLTTVIMVLLMGLARVVLAMSRDGLLPRSLSKTSEKRSTPARLQIICGAAVALVAGLTNVDLLEEMINIGTLSAFVMVSLGILVLRKKRPDLKPAFRVPFGKVLPVGFRGAVPVPDDQPRRGDLDLLRNLAGGGHCHLLRLRPAPFPPQREVRRRQGLR
jgi:amino acid transporter